MSSALTEEFRFYRAHQDEMVEKYNGKVIALKDKVVIGVYDTLPMAYYATKKEHDPGTFLLQEVSPGDEAYTTTIHAMPVYF